MGQASMTSQGLQAAGERLAKALVTSLSRRSPHIEVEAIRLPSPISDSTCQIVEGTLEVRPSDFEAPTWGFSYVRVHAPNGGSV